LPFLDLCLSFLAKNLDEEETMDKLKIGASIRKRTPCEATDRSKAVWGAANAPLIS
jgi:hypothetical protein